MKLRKWFIALLHGMTLVLFSWIWISTYSSYGDEAVLIKWSSAIKRTLLGLDEDPPAKEFLFVDVSSSKELIPDEQALGNQVITDRAALAAFFRVMRSYPNSARFVFCDVNLIGDSPNDSLLADAINGVKNIAFPVHRENDSLILPKFNTRYAVADYKQTGQMFLKFRLVQDEQLPTVPVHLYNQLDKGNIHTYQLYSTDNDRLAFNNMVIDFPIRPYEFFEQREYPIVSLAELMILPPEVISKEYLKDKLVLMGDFRTDMHPTIYGETPGTLILLNSYLALKNGYHRVSWVWVLCLLLFYTAASYKLFFSRENRELRGIRRYSFMAALLNYLALFAVAAILSYLLFRIYINILILAVYFNCLALGIDLYTKKRTLPKWHEIMANIKDTYFNFK